jgi:hypothetical protein
MSTKSVRIIGTLEKRFILEYLLRLSVDFKRQQVAGWIIAVQVVEI